MILTLPLPLTCVSPFQLHHSLSRPLPPPHAPLLNMYNNANRVPRDTGPLLPAQEVECHADEQGFSFFICILQITRIPLFTLAVGQLDMYNHCEYSL